MLLLIIIYALYLVNHEGIIEIPRKLELTIEDGVLSIRFLRALKKGEKLKKHVSFTLPKLTGFGITIVYPRNEKSYKCLSVLVENKPALNLTKYPDEKYLTMWREDLNEWANFYRETSQ